MEQNQSLSESEVVIRLKKKKKDEPGTQETFIS